MFGDTSSFKNIQGGTEEKKEDIHHVAKKEINMIYESYATNRERVDVIKEAVRKVSHVVENSEETLANLEACVEIENKKQFVDAIFQATQSLINLKIDSPEPLVVAGEDSKERIRVNNLLLYEIKGDCLDLHVSPNKVVEHPLKELADGFYKIAGLVKDNAEIKKIEGESWIIARHPKLMKKFGFTLIGESYESKTGGLVNKAYMSREEFLDRYLKKYNG